MDNDILKSIPVFTNIKISKDGKMLIFPVSVATLGITEEGKVLLVEQYRETVTRNTFELPGGKVEEGESLADAAERELFEEAGYSARDFKLIFSLDMDFADSTHITHVHFTRLGDQKHPKEDTLTHTIYLDQALEMVMEGRITHAPTVAALWWLKAEGVTK